MRESLLLLRQAEAAAVASYAGGTSTQASLLRIQVEAASLEDRIRSSESKGAGQRARLAALLGHNTLQRRPHPETPPHMAPLMDTVSEAVDSTDATNPVIRARHHRLEAASSTHRLASMNRLPDFQLSAQYMPQGRHGSEWQVGVALTLPTWQGKYRADTRETESELEAARMRLHDERLRVNAELRALYEDYHDAAKRLELLEGVLIPRARQAVELELADYRSGRSQATSLFDAQQSLIEHEIRRADQIARRERAAAAIDQRLGRQYGQTTEPRVIRGRSQ